MLNEETARLTEIMEEQRMLVMRGASSTTYQYAINAAYWQAMIEAAEDDPMDDPDVQAELIRYMKNSQARELQKFMEYVNSYM